jgi:hypothetical protein
MVDKHRKNTRILEWFGPPERNTLRPLGGCIALDLESLRVSELACLQPERPRESLCLCESSSVSVLVC